MRKPDQIVLVVTFFGFSWLAMQVAHELGHVLGAVMTGGRVTNVILHPLTISRTDVHPNPRPLLVAWAGPVFGAFLPAIMYLIARGIRLPGLFLFRFFAGFCLIANGAYIGGGAFTALADAGDMLRHGSSICQLSLFGVVTTAMGLYLWNGLGPHFGFGKGQGGVDRRATLASFILLTILVTAEIVMAVR